MRRNSATFLTQEPLARSAFGSAASIGANAMQSSAIEGTIYLGPTQYPPSHCVYRAKKTRYISGSNIATVAAPRSSFHSRRNPASARITGGAKINTDLPGDKRNP